MPRANGSAQSSKARVWTGIALTALLTLFLLFDAVTKLIKFGPVVQASIRLALPLGTLPMIGAILLVCTTLYAIPRTAVLGAVLLTGYLGGATAVQIRAANSVFETCFPAIFGVLVWTGIALRETRVFELMPTRSARRAA